MRMWSKRRSRRQRRNKRGAGGGDEGSERGRGGEGVAGEVEEEEDVGCSKSVRLSAGSLVLQGFSWFCSSTAAQYQQQQISWSEPVSGQINGSASPSPDRPGSCR